MAPWHSSPLLLHSASSVQACLLRSLALTLIGPCAYGDVLLSGILDRFGIVSKRPHIFLAWRIFRAVCSSSSSVQDVLPLVMSELFWVPSPCIFKVALTVLRILWFHLVLLLGRGVRPPWDTACLHYGHSFWWCLMSNRSPESSL